MCAFNSSFRIDEWYELDYSYYKLAPAEELYFMAGYSLGAAHSGLSTCSDHKAKIVYAKSIDELRNRYNEECARERNRTRLHEIV